MKQLVFFSLFVVPLFVSAQVNIPDVSFKAYLLGNSSINTNSDAFIQVAEATAFTGNIDVGFSGISDLTGIEAFTALTQLDCDNNSLTTLDVSQNTALTTLYCFNNPLLTSLDVSGATALTDLVCFNNSLTALDVSQNTALKGLFCQNNSLTSLDVRNGNNVNFVNFFATGNASLTCISVDDSTYSNANWSLGKDAWASFNNNCLVGIEDNKQIQPTITTNNNTITIAGAEGTVGIYNLLGQRVHQSKLTGKTSIALDKGIYLVRVTLPAGQTGSRGRSVTRKVYLH